MHVVLPSEVAGKCPYDGTKLRVRPGNGKNGSASRVSMSHPTRWCR